MTENNVEVIMLDLEGKFLDNFPSIVDAEKKTKIDASCIQHNLRGTTLSTHGVFFVAKEYYNPLKNYSKKFRSELKKFKKKSLI